MTIKEYFGDWWKCINPKALEDIMNILPGLYKSAKVYPEYKNIFKAFELCPYQKLSVIIIGQDPYFDGNATGIAFANRNETENLSPSLEILKNCIKNLDISKKDSIFAPDLVRIVKQGVLLLNSSLTVEENNPGNHTMLWRPFMTSFIKNLGEWNPGLIYVLLGEQARTFKPYIGRFNDIIECKHPAYYARTGNQMPNIFKEIDKLTLNKNNFKVNWI